MGFECAVRQEKMQIPAGSIREFQVQIGLTVASRQHREQVLRSE